MEKSKFDLGFRCGYFLSMASGRGDVKRDVFVGINDGKITAIEPWTPSLAKVSAYFIDAGSQAVLPGLINGHTHLPMTLFRGVADDMSFQEWLHSYILPLEGKMVDPRFVEAGAELAALECIEAGVTTVADMYFFSEYVAATLDRAGLRARVGQAIADFPTPDDPKQKGEAFQTLDRMLAKFRNHDRISAAAAPHAPYTCSDETLKKAKAYARERRIEYMIHVSETKFEVDESIKKYGKTPVQRLFDLGVMDEQTVFAHGVRVTDDDIVLMKESGTSVIYNPESNMKLGSGAAPVPKYLKAGITVGLGTDGSASNNDLSIVREMDSGAKLQKLIHGDGAAVTALQMLNAATLEGARALGLEEITGSLEVGKRADLIVLDLTKAAMHPLYDLVSQIVYSASGDEIVTVVCDGKILMQNKEVKTLDREKIFSRAAEYEERVRAVIGK